MENSETLLALSDHSWQKPQELFSEIHSVKRNGHFLRRSVDADGTCEARRISTGRASAVGCAGI